MIVLEADMHSIIWVLIFGPPCLAFVIWQQVAVGTSTRNKDSLNRVRLGKYGFWVILTIFYTVAFATALAKHKL
jgi:hypothetical protein